MKDTGDMGDRNRIDKLRSLWKRYKRSKKEIHTSERYTPEREEEIDALEKLKVKTEPSFVGLYMEQTYIGNCLSERLKPFGIEGE